MLKIKDEKWQEFCDIASEFGFAKEEFGYIDCCNVYISLETKHIGELLSGDCGGVEYVAYDNLYNLVEQGFVEKV